MSFKEDVATFRDGIVLSRNILVEYIYAIRDNTSTDTEVFNIIKDEIIEQNNDYGTFDNSERLNDLDYLSGLLDAYDSHIAQLDQIWEGTY